jgi:nicotinamidase-related amidase
MEARVGRALIVIDVQNDYFPGGNFPLWNADGTLAGVERAMSRARQQGIPVVIVQHVAAGPSPFLGAGTPGVAVHPRIASAAPDAPLVVKAAADAFLKTTLAETLATLGATELLVCGMMTQHCVTHTAISKFAEKYDVTVLADACTTVSEVLHAIALSALSARVRVLPVNEAL